MGNQPCSVCKEECEAKFKNYLIEFNYPFHEYIYCDKCLAERSKNECRKCNERFESRNKLFDHLTVEGHEDNEKDNYIKYIFHI